MKKLFFTALMALFLTSAQAQETIKDTSKTVTAPTKAIRNHQPYFPGGMKAFLEYLTPKIEQAAYLSGEHGKILISFIIERDGSIDDVIIKKGIEKNLNKAVIKAIKESPKWIPGYKEDKPVRAQFNLPIKI